MSQSFRIKYMEWRERYNVGPDESHRRPPTGLLLAPWQLILYDLELFYFKVTKLHVKCLKNDHMYRQQRTDSEYAWGLSCVY